MKIENGFDILKNNYGLYTDFPLSFGMNAVAPCRVK